MKMGCDATSKNGLTRSMLFHEHETLQMPQGFFSGVWNVYKATMQDPSYFFSIHELLLFARLARVNLVVTTYQQDEFCVAGSTGSVQDTSSVVYVCLSGHSHARVRGQRRTSMKTEELGMWNVK